MRTKVLIVDDEIMICKSLEAGLTDAGYSVVTARNSEEAMKAVRTFKPRIVLTDMKLGNENGIDLIDRIKSENGDIEVIVMTAYSDISSAVLAIKKGAFDYINKPFELEHIEIILMRALENSKLKNKLEVLEKLSESPAKIIIGDSPVMQSVFKNIERLSQNDSVTVLITGETGTGKELVADAIHHSSIRKNSPLLKINCSAIPENLLESELFGFEKNAFTGASAQKKGLFELANGGTVFLDELGELPMEMQAKLLRFLEERKFRRIGGLEDIEVDIRLIAATNQNLEQSVKEKRFREDLYYRINVVPIELPPLRQRGDDILLLADYFLKIYRTKFNKSVNGFTDKAKELLLSYSWPGNIRELKNIIERSVILTDNDWITEENVPAELQKISGKNEDLLPGEQDSVDHGSPLSLDRKLEEIEKNCISIALEKAGGNQTRAAAMLGISRFALKRKMEKFML